MELSKPTGEQWARLYSAAVEFEKIKPWEWLKNEELFAIKNPENGEIAYCSTMGKLGELLGLSAYLGPQGLYGYIEILSGDYEGDPEMLHLQKCLMATFEDRENQNAEDMEIIRELGYKFRGKKKWPLFRSYRPGFLPWYLNDWETRFLGLILEQAKEIVLRFKEDSSILTPPNEGMCLIRIPEVKGEIIIWKDSFIELEPRKEDIKIEKFEDEIRIRSVKKSVRMQGGMWEIDNFYSPSPVEGVDRPYYPMVMVVVDGDEGQVVSFHLSETGDFMKEFQNKLIEIIGELKIMPSRILIEKRELYEALKDISNMLGAEIKLVRKCTFIGDVKSSMYEFFMNQEEQGL